MQDALPIKKGAKAVKPERQIIRRQRKWLRRVSPLLTIVALLVAWQLVVWAELYPRFLIPAPVDVAEAFVEALRDGELIYHTFITFYELIVGLIVGVSVGSFLGYAIAKYPLLEDLLAPIVVAFQATPVVAYAPLLIIWFGSGVTGKIVTAAIIVFFPTLMNTVVGLRAVPNGLRDLMRALNATPWQMFIKLELPAGLAVLLTGLKTSATLAVIGAVVGEFVSVGDGLGSMITVARNQYDTALVIVYVLTMTALALSLYTGVSVLERRLLSWQRRSGSGATA